MHQELIRELAMITDEERRILEGKQEIDPQLYTEKKEMVVDSAKLLKKGKLIQVRPHTRFVHFPAHTHNYIEVIYMCQGTTTHIVNGNQVVLEQGDLLFLNQNAVQEILPAGEYDIAVNFIVLPEFRYGLEVCQSGRNIDLQYLYDRGRRKSAERFPCRGVVWKR